MIKDNIMKSYSTFGEVSFFQKIVTNSTLIIGEDIPNSKVKNRTDLKGLNYIKLPTRHINFFGRILTFHKGLLSQFKKDKPEIIERLIIIPVIIRLPTKPAIEPSMLIAPSVPAFTGLKVVIK